MASIIAASRLERSRSRLDCSESSTISSQAIGAWHADAQKKAEGTGELVAGRWPLIIQPNPDSAAAKAMRLRVQLALASSSNAESAFVRAGKQVKLNPSIQAYPALAECGDVMCSCYRLARPWVRSLCRDLAVKLMLDADAKSGCCDPSSGGGGLRYVSIGSGSLLADLELLTALQSAGFVIASATFVDPSYGLPTSAGRQALADIASYLGPSVRVAAYDATTTFALARLVGLEPACHLFVQMDVARIMWPECAAVSAAALQLGGVGLRLCNRGLRLGASLDAWVRVPPLDESAAAAFASLCERVADAMATGSPQLAVALFESEFVDRAPRMAVAMLYVELELRRELKLPLRADGSGGAAAAVNAAVANMVALNEAVAKSSAVDAAAAAASPAAAA